MKMITIAILLTAATGYAKIKPFQGAKTKDNAEYEEMYMSGGKSLEANDAFSAAISGAKVYRCVIQEVSMGKTGKSASLKNVKKKL